MVVVLGNRAKKTKKCPGCSMKPASKYGMTCYCCPVYNMWVHSDSSPGPIACYGDIRHHRTIYFPQCQPLNRASAFTIDPLAASIYHNVWPPSHSSELAILAGSGDPHVICSTAILACARLGGYWPEDVIPTAKCGKRRLFCCAKDFRLPNPVMQPPSLRWHLY